MIRWRNGVKFIPSFPKHMRVRSNYKNTSGLSMVCKTSIIRSLRSSLGRIASGYKDRQELDVNADVDAQISVKFVQDEEERIFMHSFIRLYIPNI